MHPYLIIFTITLLASLALVGTQHWHGRFSLDNAFGCAAVSACLMQFRRFLNKIALKAAIA